MIQNMSIKVAGVLLENQIINEKDLDIYKYGLELLISTVINLALVIAIGLFYGKFPQTLLFLFEYCFIKRYAGGYHAKTYARCISTFSILYFIMLFVIELQRINEINLSLVLACLVSNVIVIMLAPIEDCSKPLEEAQIKLFSFRCKLLVTINLLINIILFLWIENKYSFILYALLAQIWVGAAVLVGYIMNRCKKQY